MSISLDTQQRMAEALTLESAGNEVVSALQNSQQLVSQSSWSSAGAIVAAHTSATTDFGSLKVNDLVLHVPATAGNSDFAKVVTAGTLPNDSGVAVVGDLYVVLRAVSLPTPANIIL